MFSDSAMPWRHFIPLAPVVGGDDRRDARIAHDLAVPHRRHKIVDNERMPRARTQAGTPPRGAGAGGNLAAPPVRE